MTTPLRFPRLAGDLDQARLARAAEAEALALKWRHPCFDSDSEENRQRRLLRRLKEREALKTYEALHGPVPRWYRFE